MLQKISYYSLIVTIILLGNTASAQFLFKDITPQTGITMKSNSTNDAGPGVVVFDLDGDGWDDVYAMGGQDSDGLFLNMHDGTFRNIAPMNMKIHLDHNLEKWRTSPRGGIAFDYDNDGNTDIYSASENNDILWHNNGDGTFTDVSFSAHLDSALDQNESMSATFGDFNGDGYNDFYVVRWVEYFPEQNGTKHTVAKGFPKWLYVNHQDGTFVESAKVFGVDGDTSISNIALFFDYDRDGDLDLFLGNDNGMIGRPNRVFKNMLMETGTATFVDVTEAIGLKCRILCMGICPLDFNRDGNFDFYETSFGPDSLMKNNGDGTFTDVSQKYLPPGNGYENGSSGFITTNWSTLAGDFDNDGWQDLFITHGSLGTRFSFNNISVTNPSGHDTSLFYYNYGGGYFQNITAHAMDGAFIDIKARGAALIDFNHDGKLDIALGSLSTDPFIKTWDYRILQNITPDNPGHDHWLEMRFTAKRTAKEGIGTIVDVWAHGNRYSRQISTGGGYGSQTSLMQHVGLGDYAVADSIVVYWPGDKNRHRQIDRYYNVKADTILQFVENTDLNVATPSTSNQVQVFPNPASKVLNVGNLPPAILKHFEIYDLLGTKHIDVTGSENTFSLSLSSLRPGCYVLRISTNGVTETKRFIKE